MKLILILTFAFIALVNKTVGHPYEGKPHYDIKKAKLFFDKYVKDFNKHYKDEDDERIHFRAFVKSLSFINKANAERPYAYYDLNIFSDYTDEELKYVSGLVSSSYFYLL